MGRYWTRPARLAVSSRVAKLIKLLKFRTCGRSYLEDTLLEWLPQDLQDVAAELRQFIQAAHAVVREGHPARHRHAAPAEQPDVRDGAVGRDTGGL